MSAGKAESWEYRDLQRQTVTITRNVAEELLSKTNAPVGSFAFCVENQCPGNRSCRRQSKPPSICKELFNLPLCFLTRAYNAIVDVEDG